MICSHARLKQLALDHAWKKKVVPFEGSFVVGITPKGDAIAIPPKSNDIVDGQMLRAMFQEARGLGCTGTLYVYGAVTTMAGTRTYHFTQIDPKTCTIL